MIPEQDVVIVVFDCQDGDRRYLARAFEGRMFQTNLLTRAEMFTASGAYQTALRHAQFEVMRAFMYWPHELPVKPTIRYMRITLNEIEDI